METSTMTAAKQATARPAAQTRLARFLTTKNISVSKLSRVADVNLSYLFALKAGRSEPTRPVMERLRHAAAELLGDDRVRVTDLFDFGA